MTKTQTQKNEAPKSSKTFKFFDAIVSGVSACFTNFILADLIIELIG